MKYYKIELSGWRLYVVGTCLVTLLGAGIGTLIYFVLQGLAGV